MALDLDVDDGPSFAELVRDARRDVMKGRAMAACWSELADQHTFFKDIAKEGRARGEALAAVLAAVQGICQAVWCAERAHEVHSTAAHPSGAGPSPTDMIGGGVSDGTPLGETQTLSLVASAYVSLYASTPVPTRAQWVSALQPPSRCSITSETTAPATHGPSPCPSAVGRYLAKLRESVDDVARMVSHSDTEAEDGSFAEDELKELVRCCMSAGRRAARPGVLPAADARLVREMVKTLQDFVGSSTLEW
ncbi:hypothetical protein NESM_000188200 [Novymonas esmeraldas]|uniref:Uncharacterized protein n=1 Tax=Novymonas esmeraldas TaxID=1808958 RepID=A0AAW0F5F7_9TRYP